MPKKTSQNKQIAEFRKIAGELECDDSESAFDTKLGRIAKANTAARVIAPKVKARRKRAR